MLIMHVIFELLCGNLGCYGNGKDQNTTNK